MKRLIVVFIVLIIFVASCEAQNSTNTLDIENETVNEALVKEEKTKVVMGTSVTEFTEESLAKYNGKDGMPAYVAVDGVVYDVSDVDAWNKPHAGRLEPGKDYSEEIKKSPHGLKNLEGLPTVGTYK